MKRQIIFLVMYLGFASVASACTVYSSAPDWRTDPPGIPPTTYQMWTFDDDDNPAVPEVVANAYGTPLAHLSGEYYSPLQWKQTYQGHEGVWCAGTLDLVLEIPNQQVLQGYKEIWAEVIYQGYLYDADVSADPQGSAVILLGQETTNVSCGWKKLNIGWRLEPNPYSETVSLQFTGTGGYVDSVTVDTRCIPEPATLLILGVGSLALLRKRGS